MKTCIKQVQKITQLAAFLLTAFSLRAQETHNTLDHRINVLFGLTQPLIAKGFNIEGNWLYKPFLLT